MWCLARFLPLLIGDKVPDGDENWENYLQLLDIVEYTFAPIITHEKADYIGMIS